VKQFLRLKLRKNKKIQKQHQAETTPITLILRPLVWIRRGFEQLFASLTRRIVILNLTALAVLVAWIIYLNPFRDTLIEARIDSLRSQGRIIAGAVAASAALEMAPSLIDPERMMELQAGESLAPQFNTPDNWDFPINPERASPLLRSIISPATTRVRIYDRDAKLLLDSRQLYSSSQISSYNLPPLVPEENWFEGVSNWLTDRIFGDVLIFGIDSAPDDEADSEQIAAAIKGTLATAQRREHGGELVVSVAVPISRYHAVIGVLLLSTIASDIDEAVRNERQKIFAIFATVSVVMLILSLCLASTIANPLRKLAAAADRVRHGTFKRVTIPDFSMRHDEIGHLSNALRDMTDALYNRIEAIERFAADVSHELKNPLTSLRSAVETLPLATKDAPRQKLMDVIQHDVKRLDRLISDISDASRLDGELAREDKQKVDMHQLLEVQVNAAHQVRRQQKTTTITLDIAPTSGKKRQYLVAGHDLRLGQVITNLVENARSFIPDEGGEIRIRMQCNSNRVQIMVEDNGPGIRPEAIERIFERFYTDRPEGENFGQNSGLGLSISRQIIEAHEGTLNAENIMAEDGKILGSRFIIDLPALN